MNIYLIQFIGIMLFIILVLISIILGDKVYDIYANIKRHYKGKKAAKTFLTSSKKDDK